MGGEGHRDQGWGGSEAVRMLVTRYIGCQMNTYEYAEV